MFCSKCGKAIAEGAQFCANCGTPVVPTTAKVTKGPLTRADMLLGLDIEDDRIRSVVGFVGLIIVVIVGLYILRDSGFDIGAWFAGLGLAGGGGLLACFFTGLWIPALAILLALALLKYLLSGRKRG